MVEIVVKIMEELISTLALVTKSSRSENEVSSSSLMCYLTPQRDTDKLKNILRGKAADEDIRDALQRLDRLTQHELRNVAAQTLGAVSGEQTHSVCNLTSTEYHSLDVQTSVDGVRGDTSTFCRRQEGASLSD